MQTYGIWKDSTDEPICRAAMEDTDIEKRLADTVGEEEAGTNWESSMETYLLPYVK